MKKKNKNNIHIFQLDENFSSWPFKVVLGRSSKAWVKGETKKKLLVDDTFDLEPKFGTHGELIVLNILRALGILLTCHVTGALKNSK